MHFLSFFTIKDFQLLHCGSLWLWTIYLLQCMCLYVYFILMPVMHTCQRVTLNWEEKEEEVLQKIRERERKRKSVRRNLKVFPSFLSFFPFSLLLLTTTNYIRVLFESDIWGMKGRFKALLSNTNNSWNIIYTILLLLNYQLTCFDHIAAVSKQV